MHRNVLHRNIRLKGAGANMNLSEVWRHRVHLCRIYRSATFSNTQAIV